MDNQQSLPDVESKSFPIRLIFPYLFQVFGVIDSYLYLKLVYEDENGKANQVTCNIQKVDFIDKGESCISFLVTDGNVDKIKDKITEVKIRKDWQFKH